ncbi:C6 zinc finger domain protein [Rutstroemia sp. NJR-2017a WRK4]|nr:C6 zinc finger domain protein [Rutstroemia sp. NJR-2017a WRK4]
MPILSDQETEGRFTANLYLKVCALPSVTSSNVVQVRSSISMLKLSSSKSLLRLGFGCAPTPRSSLGHTSLQTLGKERRENSAEDIRLSNTVSWLESDAFENSKPAVSSNDTLLSDEVICQEFGTSCMSLWSPSHRTDKLDEKAMSILPSRKEAQPILQYFIHKVNWIYHLVHIPTLERNFSTLYDDIEGKKQPRYDVLALVSTVFALSTYFQDLQSLTVSRRWTLLAQSALAAANYVTEPTLETIQCVLLIAQHLLPNVGGIAIFRVLFSTALHSARSLALDRVDLAINKKRREGTRIDYVELETKRRIWWHITATDWILSFMSGPQCGTYSIHPQQMNVDHPSNVNDMDICASGNYGRSLDFITEMTFYIFRCKLSIVCREIVDTINGLGCEIHEAPYETILDFDKRLNDLSSSLPVAFRIDGKSKAEAKELAEKYPFVALQRTAGHFGLQTRLARLHRPYLIRGTYDPRYSYSRMICLRASRSVIELGKVLKNSSAEHDFQPIRMWPLTHHLFVATAILVMDFCLNKDDPRPNERKTEVLDCLQVLEECSDSSLIAKRGLMRLRDILEKRCADKMPSDESISKSAPTSLLINSSKLIYGPVESTSAGVRASDTHQDFPGFDSAVDWENFDFSSLENINFDVDLAAHDFETLFHPGGVNAPFISM